MPMLNVELVLALIGCFVTGTWLAATLERRRFRHRIEVREQEMAHVLHERYQAYERLERCVHSLIAKFDTLENEFRQKVAIAANPDILIEKTVKLRSLNPELWDIEREHHRERSKHLAEISRQAQRISELMDQMPSLENAQNETRAELETIRARHEVAVANANDSEQAALAKVARLEHRVGELESVESLLDGTRRDLESMRSTQGEARARHEQIVGKLQQRLDALQPFEGQVASLSEDLAQMRRDSAQKELDSAKREGEIEKLTAACQSLDQRSRKLTQELESAKQAAAETGKVLQGTRDSQAALQGELERCRGELESTKQSAAKMREELDSTRGLVQSAQAEAEGVKLALDQKRGEQAQVETSLATTQAELAQYRAKLSAHSSHIEQAWSVLSGLKPMLQELEEKLKDGNATEQPAKK